MCSGAIVAPSALGGRGYDGGGDCDRDRSRTWPCRRCRWCYSSRSSVLSWPLTCVRFVGTVAGSWSCYHAGR